MSRVVVVGGGLAGTAAAARLAKQGHEVTLVERRDRVGGAVGFVERDGYRWDAGPTTTALPAVLRDLFRKSGRPLERELDLVPVEPMREHRFPDGSVLPMPSGSRASQLAAVEDALGRAAAVAWVDYVHGFADTWDLLRRAYLERPYSPGHVDPAARALLRTRSSLQKVVTRSLADRRLRGMALVAPVLEGQDPRRVPWWVGMWSYVEQRFGLWTVPGGMGRLAQALSDRLAQRRVCVMVATTVVDLRVEQDRVVGVDTDDGSVLADRVVCAVDPRGLPALAPHLPRTTVALPPSVCHLGLAGDVPELPHEVVLHGDPTLVIRTNGASPPGGRAWTVLSPGRVADDPVVSLAGRGIDVRDHVVVRVDRSPRDQLVELAGSPYGLVWDGRRTTDHKLRSPPYRGLYLVGAHAAAGAAVPYVGLSAAVVAEQLGSARG